MAKYEYYISLEIDGVGYRSGTLYVEAPDEEIAQRHLSKALSDPVGPFMGDDFFSDAEDLDEDGLPLADVTWIQWNQPHVK